MSATSNISMYNLVREAIHSSSRPLPPFRETADEPTMTIPPPGSDTDRSTLDQQDPAAGRRDPGWRDAAGSSTGEAHQHRCQECSGFVTHASTCSARAVKLYGVHVLVTAENCSCVVQG